MGSVGAVAGDLVTILALQALLAISGHLPGCPNNRQRCQNINIHRPVLPAVLAKNKTINQKGQIKKLGGDLWPPTADQEYNHFVIQISFLACPFNFI